MPENDERLAQNQDIVEGLARHINLSYEPNIGKLVRPSDAISEPFQRWFRYREGFTVELCRPFIGAANGTVLDPFCGFGSTLVAAQQAGVPSVGLDVSPLASFVSTVKTRRYSAASKQAILRAKKRLLTLTANAPIADPPIIRILPKLFHSEILHALMVFRAAIDTTVDQSAREFLLLAWIAILERVSNVYREGNGIKYRNRKRTGNLYTVVPYEDWQRNRFPGDKFDYVRLSLTDQLDVMLEDVESSHSVQPIVANADAKTARSFVPSKGVSLALFSPPYCNCFNYIKAYKLELWMGGFIKAYPDIPRLTAMGIRSRTESLRNPVSEPYPAVVEDLAQLMSKGTLWSKQLPDVIRGYFADMQSTLEVLRHSIQKKGQCVIVVGNSAYAGILIPSDLLLCQIAQKVGFEVEELIVARSLTTSSQQKRQMAPLSPYLRESVLVLNRAR